MPRCRLCGADILIGFDHYIAADGYIWHQVCFRWETHFEELIRHALIATAA